MKQRTIRSKRKPRYTQEQQTAYHEAAHAVAALHVGIPFEEIEVTPDSKQHRGVMRRRWWTPWEHEKPSDLQDLFITLAGPAAEKHMHPGHSWLAIALSGATGDFRQAGAIAERAVGKAYSEELVDDVTRTALTFVRNEWDRIVKLGDALLASEGQFMKYDDCRVALGMRPSWQEPVHPEVQAFLAAQAAGDSAAA